MIDIININITNALASGAIEEILKDLFHFDFLTAILKAALAFFSDMMGLFFSLITTDITTYNEGAVWNAVGTVFQTLLAVALVVANMFVWVELFESTTRWVEIKKSSVLITFAVQIVVVNAVIYYSKDILATVYGIVQGVVVKVMKDTGMITADGTATFFMQLPTDFEEGLDALGLGAYSLMLPIILIISAWIVVSTIVIMLTVFVRIFNLYLLLALSPLAFACAMSKRTRFVFTNFLRTFCSVALELLMLVVVIYLFSKFFGSEQMALMAPTVDSPYLKLLYTMSPIMFLGEASGQFSIVSILDGEEIPNMLGIIEYLVVLAFLFSVLVGVIKGSDKLVQKIFGIG